MKSTEPTEKDYIYCETCEMFVDFWKYDHNLEDAGHDGHRWRYATKKELPNLIEGCKEFNCFEEA